MIEIFQLEQTNSITSAIFTKKNYNELKFSFALKTASTPEALQSLHAAISVSLQLFIMQSKAQVIYNLTLHGLSDLRPELFSKSRWYFLPQKFPYEQLDALCRLRFSAPWAAANIWKC